MRLRIHFFERENERKRQTRCAKMAPTNRAAHCLHFIWSKDHHYYSTFSGLQFACTIVPWPKCVAILFTYAHIYKYMRNECTRILYEKSLSLPCTSKTYYILLSQNIPWTFVTILFELNFIQTHTHTFRYMSAAFQNIFYYGYEVVAVSGAVAIACCRFQV